MVGAAVDGAASAMSLDVVVDEGESEASAGDVAGEAR